MLKAAVSTSSRFFVVLKHQHSTFQSFRRLLIFGRRVYILVTIFKIIIPLRTLLLDRCL